MKIQWNFADGTTSEVEVDEELGAVITAKAAFQQSWYAATAAVSSARRSGTRLINIAV